MKKTLIIILVLCLTFVPASADAYSAESCILMDADTGRVLYEENADKRMLIASTTKIMTALAAVEHGDVNDQVTIAPETENVEGSSMYLRTGDKMRLEELLYGMMLVSGNDAAAAVACHISGDVDSFVELMNEKANELGMDNTSFANPHGLDDENHYSTARDMAVLMRAAMDNEELARIFATKTVTINGVTYKNHNKLLWMYDGVIAGKTGYTMAAGRTLVSCCEREGARLICVTLSDPDDWDDHMALYDWAFENYKPVTAAEENDSWELPVIGGESDTVTVRPSQTVTVRTLEGDDCQTVIELPGFIYARINEGDVVGRVTVTVNGEPAAEADIVCAQTVRRVTPEGRTLTDRLKGLIETYLHSFEM